jgi:hypothetical protein
MPQYTGAFVPGGTFFFTVRLSECRWKILTEHLDDLRAVFSCKRRDALRFPATVYGPTGCGPGPMAGGDSPPRRGGI